MRKTPLEAALVMVQEADQPDYTGAGNLRELLVAVAAPSVLTGYIDTYQRELQEVDRIAGELAEAKRQARDTWKELRNSATMQGDLFEAPTTVRPEDAEAEKGLRRAHAQGIEAGKSGAPLSANPYIERTRKEAWEVGWRSVVQAAADGAEAGPAAAAAPEGAPIVSVSVLGLQEGLARHQPRLHAILYGDDLASDTATLAATEQELCSALSWFRTTPGAMADAPVECAEAAPVPRYNIARIYDRLFVRLQAGNEKVAATMREMIGAAMEEDLRFALPSLHHILYTSEALKDGTIAQASVDALTQAVVLAEAVWDRAVMGTRYGRIALLRHHPELKNGDVGIAGKRAKKSGGSKGKGAA